MDRYSFMCVHTHLEQAAPRPAEPFPKAESHSVRSSVLLGNRPCMPGHSCRGRGRGRGGVVFFGGWGVRIKEIDDGWKDIGLIT